VKQGFFLEYKAEKKFLNELDVKLLLEVFIGKTEELRLYNMV
jgi:hypothetical protein